MDPLNTASSVRKGQEDRRDALSRREEGSIVRNRGLELATFFADGGVREKVNRVSQICFWFASFCFGASSRYTIFPESEGTGTLLALGGATLIPGAILAGRARRIDSLALCALALSTYFLGGAARTILPREENVANTALPLGMGLLALAYLMYTPQRRSIEVQTRAIQCGSEEKETQQSPAIKDQAIQKGLEDGALCYEYSGERLGVVLVYLGSMLKEVPEVQDIINKAFVEWTKQFEDTLEGKVTLTLVMSDGIRTLTIKTLLDDEHFEPIIRAMKFLPWSVEELVFSECPNLTGRCLCAIERDNTEKGVCVSEDGEEARYVGVVTCDDEGNTIREQRGDIVAIHPKRFAPNHNLEKCVFIGCPNLEERYIAPLHEIPTLVALEVDEATVSISLEDAMWEPFSRSCLLRKPDGSDNSEEHKNAFIQELNAFNKTASCSRDSVASATRIFEDLLDAISEHHRPGLYILETIDFSGMATLTSEELIALARCVNKYCGHLRTLVLGHCSSAVTDEVLEAFFCEGARINATLQECDIQRCDDVTDKGIQAITRARGLKTLRIGYSQVTDLGIKAIGQHLHELLELNANKCIGPTQRIIRLLKECSELRILGINGCRDLGDSDMELLAASFPKLEALDVQNCNITNKSIIAIAALSIQRLKVVDCMGIEDITPLGTMPLEILDLSGCGKMTGAAELFKIGMLRAIHMYECDLTITDEDLKDGIAYELRSIDFSGALNITDDGVGNLLEWAKNIVTMRLMGPNITDDTLITLAANAKKLETLDLGGCDLITAPALIGLIDKLTKLKTLLLQRLTFDNEEITECFQDMTMYETLEYLNMSYCSGEYFVEVLKFFFSRMPNLLALSIKGCDDINDNFLNTMMMISHVKDKLGTLNISRCDFVTEKGVERLKEMKALQFLTMRDVPELTKNVLMILLDFKTLKSVDIRNNMQISPEDVEDFIAEYSPKFKILYGAYIGR